MKFGKNLLNIAEMSDPEWNVYWVNYKNLKKKINEIVENRGGEKLCPKPELSRDPDVLSGSSVEVEFFKMLRRELKKTSDFYASTESIFRIRYQWVVVTGFDMLNYVDTPPPPPQETTKPIINPYDEQTWMRLLAACVKFYKDCLLLETFALTNYCAFSKILKKHDKVTGFHTREAFMRNVVSKQNFTYYPTVVELLKQSEKLFSDVQIKLKRSISLSAEERLFIEAMRELNKQAILMHEQSNSDPEPDPEHSHENEHESGHESVHENSSDSDHDKEAHSWPSVSVEPSHITHDSGDESEDQGRGHEHTQQRDESDENEEEEEDEEDEGEGEGGEHVDQRNTANHESSGEEVEYVGLSI